ncbi:NepR family anti-sigma factor [Sulfitobacter marinus]
MEPNPADECLVPHGVQKYMSKSGKMSMQLGNNEEKERFIDENLRRVYEETMDEGIPDKFKDLLNKLKEQEKSGGKSE